MHNTPNVTIVGGTGQFGQWYARFFSENGWQVTIAGRDPEKAKAVAEKLGVHSAAVEDACRKADVIIVSVSLSASPEALEKAGKLAKPGALLCDFCSIKGGVAKTYAVLEKARPDLELLSVHPMHGPRVSTVMNRPVAFVAVRAGERAKSLMKLFSDKGARSSTLDFEKHDSLMSFIQGMTHVSAIAGGLTMKCMGLSFGDVAPYSTPNNEIELAQIARVTLQNPQLYSEIQATGKANAAARKLFIENVKRLDAAADKPHEFEALIRQAGEPLGQDAERLLKAGDNAEYALHYTLYAQPEGQKRTWLEDVKDAKFTIAILGPKGTFSEKAADDYLDKEGLKAHKLFVSSITDVFDLVQKGDVEEGIVPIENLLEGSVSQTLDNLANRKVTVYREIIIPIHHCLITLPKAARQDLDRIYSHPQALGQCHGYLRTQFPNAELVPVSSTSAGAELIAEKSSSRNAAIGSASAAERLGLKILEENIEDEKNNVTRFLIIGKKKASPTGNDKTSIIVHATEDRPGLLMDTIKGFAKRKINMSRIESRPSRKKMGIYYFYIELNAHQDSPELKAAIAELEQNRVGTVTYLGSYPVCPNPVSIH